MKIRPLEAEMFHADGQTDRQTGRQIDRKTDRYDDFMEAIPLCDIIKVYIPVFTSDTTIIHYKYYKLIVVVVLNIVNYCCVRRKHM